MPGPHDTRAVQPLIIKNTHGDRSVCSLPKTCRVGSAPHHLEQPLDLIAEFLEVEALARGQLAGGFRRKAVVGTLLFRVALECHGSARKFLSCVFELSHLGERFFSLP